MTSDDIAHFIQRQDEELLDYHPWDEGTDREVETGEDDWHWSERVPDVPRSMPLPPPDLHRCRVLVNNVEAGGVIDVATGVVALDDAPAPGPFSLCVVEIAEGLHAEAREWCIVEHTGELSPYLDGEALQQLAVGPEPFSMPLMRCSAPWQREAP